MGLTELFETYLHSLALLEELQGEFEIYTVEDLYDWLIDFPAGSEAVLMDYFESHQDLVASCEEMLGANTVD